MKHLIPQDIDNIYNKYIMCNNTSEYLNRYNNLPIDKNNMHWKWEGKDFPRIIALLEFGRMVEKYNLSSYHLLMFNSYDDPELEYLPHYQYSNYRYSDDPINYDLHNLNIPKLEYDFCMLNQTFEHLYNPYKCLENIYDYITIGGYIYCNVPVVNFQHSLPNNFYTGITPVGFACMFKSCGFEIIEAGQWGNSDYISKLFSTHSWPDYREVVYRNEFHNPAQCWILAQKQ